MSVRKASERLRAAFDADHRQIVGGAEPTRSWCQADQLGVGWHDRFGHADLIGAIDEVGTAER